MSLKTRLIVFAFGILLVAASAMVFMNYRNQKSSLEDLNSSNLEDIKWSISKQIEFFMMNAENEKLVPLIEEMVSRGMLEQMSIVNAERIVARDNDSLKIGSVDNDPIWESVFENRNDSTFEKRFNGIPSEFSYMPLLNAENCVDCHDDEIGAPLGGVKMVKSKQNLASANSRSLANNIIVMAVCGVLFMVVLFMLINRKIFKPLADVGSRLDAAALGNIEQNFNVDSNDEIGRLLNSIANLIGYLRELSAALEKVADNDLGIKVEPRSGQDRVGHSFKTMLRNLGGVISQLGASSSELLNASEAIAHSSDEMSKGVDEQSSQISQVAAAVEQIASTIVESTRNANDASQASIDASQAASQGEQLVSNTISSMQEISEAVSRSAESIDELSKTADQIGQITVAINDIADQTNLLALNAAIEAARAGEQGRGFAVVADEVRKLADRTSRATGEISEIVKHIQTVTADAVKSMQMGVNKVSKGTGLAEQAGQSLNEIVRLSKQSVDMIRQIATASEQQSQAAESISKSVAGITNIISDTAQSARKSVGITEEVNAQAEGLNRIVERFKLK